jgi:Virulence factor BrkB
MATSKLSTEQQVESIWALGGLTPLLLIKNVWKEIDQDNVTGRGSELAYNYLLAIFPFMLFLLAVFGLFAARGTVLRTNLLFYFSEVLPPAAFELLAKTIDEVTKNSTGGKVTLGIALALWAASGGMTAMMMSALNGAYGVRESRSWIKIHAIAVGLTIAISILVISALALVLAGGHIANFAGAKLHLGWVAVTRTPAWESSLRLRWLNEGPKRSRVEINRQRVEAVVLGRPDFQRVESHLAAPWRDDLVAHPDARGVAVNQHLLPSR